MKHVNATAVIFPDRSFLGRQGGVLTNAVKAWPIPKSLAQADEFKQRNLLSRSAFMQNTFWNKAASETSL